MLYKPALCLAAALCLAITITHAQSVDSLTGKLANFPTRLFGKIQSQSASLNQTISTQTQKLLARMARREQQMQQRLAAVDSKGAKSLFAGSQQQYAALAAQVRNDSGGRPVRLSGQYVPYADTLQGAMTFLQQHAQLLSGSSVSKMQGAASQFHALQAKMQDADIVKVYVQSRQQQVSQFLAQHSNLTGVLGKPLAGMQQEQYYFSQRVAQYKALFSDCEGGVWSVFCAVAFGRGPTCGQAEFAGDFEAHAVDAGLAAGDDFEVHEAKIGHPLARADTGSQPSEINALIML
jgi:hypothetical protein